jgi:hypothetical protein
VSIQQQHFTDAGRNLLGAAQAGGELIITRIVVGTGAASVPADLYPLPALINWQRDVVITRKLDLGNGRMIVAGALNEAQLPAGPAFLLREVGVMARVGAGVEFLYSVANVFATAPDTITPGGTSSHAFEITLIIERAATVTVIIGDSTSIDAENIPTDASVGPGWYAQKVGNVLQFKRMVLGSAVEFVETADRIQVGLAPGIMLDYAGGSTDLPPRTVPCDGGVYAVATYPRLAAKLGARYGGNGTTTFGVPDSRGRMLMGAGQGPGLSMRTLAQVGGAESGVIAVGHLPSHSHVAWQDPHDHAVWDGGHAHHSWQDPHAHAVYDPMHYHNINVTVSGGSGAAVFIPTGSTAENCRSASSGMGATA